MVLYSARSRSSQPANMIENVETLMNLFHLILNKIKTIMNPLDNLYIMSQEPCINIFTLVLKLTAMKAIIYYQHLHQIQVTGKKYYLPLILYIH
jgi:hypothetical protein